MPRFGCMDGAEAAQKGHADESPCSNGSHSYDGGNKAKAHCRALLLGLVNGCVYFFRVTALALSKGNFEGLILFFTL